MTKITHDRQGSAFHGNSRIGNFHQKHNSADDGIDETMVFCSDGIPAVTRNRKLSEFRSEPFRGRDKCKEFGIDFSVDLRMPRNEHFLPRNNRNRSESIPRSFFRNEIQVPTLLTVA
jgi:hypothetical protein